MNTKYNKWTVLSQEKKHKGKCVYLSCKCECGVIRDVIIKNLKSGVSKNCGCVRNKKTSKRNFKHGLRFSKIWTVWRGMKHRCYNKNARQYKDYGGRGIKVCDEWKDDFMAFYNVMGDVPKGKSIDRIDNDGNYEPSNVKWSTAKQQNRNRRSSYKINGINLTDIDKSLGGSDGLVSKRLKRGWSLERAITTKSNATIKDRKDRTI